MVFDHEKLDVYRVALTFVAWAFKTTAELPTLHRHARDQLVRSSQSIVQNIAEGNGKRSRSDRRRYLEIARGSAMESAATLDILLVCEGLTSDVVESGKELLIRVVSMLSKMTQPLTDRQG